MSGFRNFNGKVLFLQRHETWFWFNGSQFQTQRLTRCHGCIDMRKYETLTFFILSFTGWLGKWTDLQTTVVTKLLFPKSRYYRNGFGRRWWWWWCFHFCSTISAQNLYRECTCRETGWGAEKLKISIITRRGEKSRKIIYVFYLALVSNLFSGIRM